ncbi:sulfate reduction electron transfer complex DsrMKJOP subunit DsrJ [Gordonibacter sp.]|uniref:sulfate reduction electron transfer complex DsrMKJOP subunit DsrJ n=1 Tax=Gordonibacter sp. TaxID=1968902 RepID=UPI002FC9B360
MGAKGKIVLFLVVICIVLLIPFAANAGTKTEGAVVSLDTPTINALSDKGCIEDAEYMRGHHMVMLEQWRDDVVREGDCTYTSSSGQTYEKSLECTCFSCHSNPDEFCSSCHDYAGVAPYCGDCHAMTDAELQAGR